MDAYRTNVGKQPVDEPVMNEKSLARRARPHRFKRNEGRDTRLHDDLASESPGSRLKHELVDHLNVRFW